METCEAEKAKVFVFAGIIEYVENSVVVKTILKKSSGTVRTVSCDTGKYMIEKIIPFDTFARIIDGKAEVEINGVSNTLDTGQAVIIPAQTANVVRGRERFKMISTILKSGCE
jgi:quercetin dioxygenase-like cupin family protein